MDIKQPILLDAGCGANKTTGFIGMDKRELEGVDIVHDLEVFPWPLDNDSCGCVVMSHVVEHIKPWLQVDLMNEIWRIMQPGGTLIIATPYGGSRRYLQDPTHCAPWTEVTVDYFNYQAALWHIYTPKPWKCIHNNWHPNGDLEARYVKVVFEEAKSE